jgi:hypothetical protein
VAKAENDLRYHDRLTVDQFDKMEFSEFVFRSEMLQKQQAQALKDSLYSASFAAWQVLRQSKGLKMGWIKYSESLGITDKKTPHLSSDEKADAISAAINIHNRITK